MGVLFQDCVAKNIVHKIRRKFPSSHGSNSCPPRLEKFLQSREEVRRIWVRLFISVVFVNNAIIGGHVEISDFVYLGGQSAVHQYCRIGKHAIIGAGTTIDGDVIPFTSVIGSRGYLSGLNLVGLKRRSFKKDEIKTLRNVYRLLFAPEGTFNERLLEVNETYSKNELVREILSFLKENLNRPLVHPKMGKH